MNRYDLVVIGGGSAGLVVAGGAAQLGVRVALIEKKALGGDCLFTGCVPSKTFIRSANFAADVRRAGDFGFAPISLEFNHGRFEAITDRVSRVISTIGEHDKPERFEAWGVEVIFANPRFLSSNELELTNTDRSKRILTAKRFCIATGSRPAIPAIDGLKETGFITNEEVFRLKELPHKLIVLGGGPIGLELGQSFARLGSDVTVVEMSDHLLPKEDKQVSAAIEDVLRAEGLMVCLNTKAIQATSANGQKILTVEHEGKRTELQADEFLVSTGRRPNIEGLNLEAARVNYNAQRILTDQYLRTSTPHIFAAGDVTGHFPFTHMAAYEGSLVIRNALLFWPLMQKVDFRVVPWNTFTDPEVARVGLTEDEAKRKFGSTRVRIFLSHFADNDRAHTEEDTKGFAKFICTGRKNEIVGAHIVGPHAGELIHEVVLAMKQRLSIAELGSMIHVYPTLTQINQQAGVEALLKSFLKHKKWLSRYLRIWR
jgi:pyruvate/2-oxoglutarate dehydrogenase complex dihydrolipoamide dehydrogenase (E3) component